ncbi:OTU-domain-containing protein [Wallemia mellicola]|nr:OTU-domain-containing protein [Wallemia mellicola]TIC16189.1 OTU-domain-containing protein [Wallemia mellicola]TIC42104.1 OTU-domain-containing protein [Wallemia mellicola]
MTSEIIRFRLRCSDGLKTLTIPASASLIDLLELIAEVSKIPIANQDLRIGYPPRHFSFSQDDYTNLATQHGLRNGEQLILNHIDNNASNTTTVEASNTINHITPPKPKNKSVDGHSVQLNSGDGWLTLRVVPDDNSCLFSAISLAILGSIDENYMMRGIVAETIKSDPITYNETFLGHPQNQYIETIADPHSWGGAIELSILSHAFKISIISLDIATGRIDKYNTEYENRIFVVYSGIHYDALSLSPSQNASAEFHTTVFPSFEAPPDFPDPLLEACKQLAGELRERRYYTDTSTFTLKCGDCGAALEGEKQATEHAANFGHTAFTEY